MCETSKILSRKFLTLFERQDLKELYLSIEPESEQQFTFSAYVFVVFTSLIINVGSNNPISPEILSSCHKDMLSWWGQNRSVRLGDFVKSSTELMLILKLVEDRDTHQIRATLLETIMPLHPLMGLCLLARIELYTDALKSNAHSSDEEAKFLSLANTTQPLITGKAISADASGINPLLHSFKLMTLSSILKEYVQGVRTIISSR